MFHSKKKDGHELHTLLRIRAPDGHVWLVDLRGESYLIGRGDPTGATKVDFQVPEDEFLSRVHCRVERDDKGYRIQNLSPNGTLVDGALIEKPTHLKPKAKIEAGEGTTITYLVVGAAERKRLFDEQAGIKERREETGGAEVVQKRPFYLRPIFLAVVGFYGVITLVVLSVVGDKETKVADPGQGPYFTYLFETPVDTRRPEGDAQAHADRMWEDALAQHGGSLLKESGHAYDLLSSARKVAGVMGYTTLKQALDKGESFAQRAQLVLDDLEERVAAWYGEAAGYVKGRHWDLAYDVYAKMAEAVPDTQSPVRRFATYRMAKLKKMR